MAASVHAVQQGSADNKREASARAPPQAGLWPGEGRRLRSADLQERMQRNQPQNRTPPSQLPEKAHQEKADLAPDPRPMAAQAEGPRPAGRRGNRRTLKGLAAAPQGALQEHRTTISAAATATRRHEFGCASWSERARSAESSGCSSRLGEGDWEKKKKKKKKKKKTKKKKKPRSPTVLKKGKQP